MDRARNQWHILTGCPLCGVWSSWSRKCVCLCVGRGWGVGGVCWCINKSIITLNLCRQRQSDTKANIPVTWFLFYFITRLCGCTCLLCCGDCTLCSHALQSTAEEGHRSDIHSTSLPTQTWQQDTSSLTDEGMKYSSPQYSHILSSIHFIFLSPHVPTATEQLASYLWPASLRV